MKVVRELGLERRETVRFLSSAGEHNGGALLPVREDRRGSTSGAPVVAPAAPPGSYVGEGQPLKASQAGSLLLNKL